MGICGFPSLGMPLNLAEFTYLEHVSSDFLFPFKICDQNWILWIVHLQFLNSSLYWSPGIIQSLSSSDQVKQFILVSVFVPDQRTKAFSSYLYNMPYRGASIFSPNPSTLSDHFKITMVYVPSSGAWLLIIAPSVDKSSIHIDSWFYSS